MSRAVPGGAPTPMIGTRGVLGRKEDEHDRLRMRAIGGADHALTPPDDPAGLSVPALTLRASHERNQFPGSTERTSPATLELFRRAVCGRADAAWSALLDLYAGQVASWCRRAGARDGEMLDELVAGAWERFWEHYTPEKFAAAAGLAAVLRYLHLCAVSAVFDHARKRTVFVALDELAESIPNAAASPLDQVVELLGVDDLRDLIGRQLGTEPERELMRLRYSRGYRPAEVHAARPDLFPSVQDVYRINRNILNRLARCSELRRLYERS